MLKKAENIVRSGRRQIKRNKILASLKESTRAEEARFLI